VYGTGEGRSKKEAEQQAAETAWRAISKGGAPLAANHHGGAADAAPAPGTGPAASRAARETAPGGNPGAGDSGPGGNSRTGRPAG
jgi:ribonuclease-3